MLFAESGWASLSHWLPPSSRLLPVVSMYIMKYGGASESETVDVDEEGETELSPRPPWRKQQGAEEGKKTSAQE